MDSRAKAMVVPVDIPHSITVILETWLQYQDVAVAAMPPSTGLQRQGS